MYFIVTGKLPNIGLVLSTLILIAGLALIPGISAQAVENSFTFEQIYIDTQYGGNGRPGWVRAGDMDEDGDLDIVAGGGYGLFIYENDGSAGGWNRPAGGAFRTATSRCSACDIEMRPAQTLGEAR